MLRAHRAAQRAAVARHLGHHRRDGLVGHLRRARSRSARDDLLVDVERGSAPGWWRGSPSVRHELFPPHKDCGFTSHGHDFTSCVGQTHGFMTPPHDHPPSRRVADRAGSPARRARHHAAAAGRLPRPVRPAARRRRPARPHRRGPARDRRRRHHRDPARRRLGRPRARPVRPDRHRRRRRPPVARLLPDPRPARRRPHLDHRQGGPGRQGQQPPRPQRAPGHPGPPRAGRRRVRAAAPTAASCCSSPPAPASPR